ncbi:MAG TPA: APC family permease [Kofleriaceae bacterium]|nr:APC family permease [Kofleriaceae bacterium]
MSATPGQPSLLRAVSRWQVVALASNDVIGSGVYILPAAAAAALGAASPWAVLGAGALVLLLVLCFAEAGSLFDEPGGAYVYTRAAFGEFVGFEVGWMTWIARLASHASLSVGFAQAVGAVWDGAVTPAGRAVTIVAALGALLVINVAGVKYGARAAVILVVSKVVPLLVLIAVGALAIHWDRIVPVPWPDSKGMGQAALPLLFAYAGFENTAAAAGEFKNPQRDVPFGLLTMIAGVTAIYVLVQFVALGVVPGLAGSQHALADAAEILMGGFGLWLLTVGGALSIFGTMNNTVLVGGRYLYALADKRFLPRALARVHPSYRTPWIALIVQTSIALPLALSGTFVELAVLSVIARMATFIGTAAAVMVLRRKLPDAPRRVRLPGGPAIPIAALVVCLIFLSSATGRNLVAGAIALAVGAVIYAVAVRRGVQAGSMTR